MPIPIAAAAAALPLAREAAVHVSKAMQHPVIGIRRVVVKHTKTRTVTTEYSAQLRAWEAGVLAIVALYVAGGIAIAGMTVNPIDKQLSDARKRAEAVPKPAEGAPKENVDKYYLDRIKAGYLGWLIP